VLLAGLWKVTGVANFSPYIFFQIVVDSILIALFLLVFLPFGAKVALVTTLLMTINLPVIKRTLMMGYDFWPQFGVLVIFIGTAWLLHKKKGSVWYLLVGVLCGVVTWFREITVFLPFFVAFFILVALPRYRRERFGPVLGKVFLFIAPVILSLVLLSLYRYETTGSYRPTRSTFWHSFFAGVGQFSNPYGLIDHDKYLYEFGVKLNPELADYTLLEMQRLPDSMYEETLRVKAKEFMTEHTGIFLRNIVYRAGAMISPLLYSSGTFLPEAVGRRLFPLGLLMLPLWFLGMIQIYRDTRWLFWLTLTVYLYFLAAFGWFYLVGRVILPFMFIGLWVYVNSVRFFMTRLWRPTRT
jgi:hypothetical protein